MGFEKEEVKSVVKHDLKDKERLIGKWKAEYKLLKIKFEENLAQENTKKEEIEGYYKSYKEYKSKNKLLEMRNKILEESANSSIEKVHQLESFHLEENCRMVEELNRVRVDNDQLRRMLEEANAEQNSLRASYSEEVEKAHQEALMRSELESKVLNLDIEDNGELHEILSEIRRRVGDQDEKLNKYIKEGKRKDELVTKLRKEIRTLLETQENELENFKNREVAETVQDMRARSYESLCEIRDVMQKEQEMAMQAHLELVEENTAFKMRIGELEGKMLELNQEVKSISHLFNFKSAELEEVREKYEDEIMLYEKRLEDVERFKNATIKNLQMEVSGRNDEVNMQRSEIKKLLSVKMGESDEPFDEVLKNQIQTSKKLREELGKKNEEVYKLRDSSALMKAELDNLKSESEICKLKFISEKKNLQVNCDVEIQQLKNQLSLEQKKMLSLENKIKMVIEENRKKDCFIQTFIMGKKLPQNEREFVAAFLREYEIVVTGKHITDKLQSESQELEKLASYNFNLMKEVAEMKEKMLMYEATSIDQDSEMRDSMELESPIRSKRLNKSQSISYAEGSA